MQNPIQRFTQSSSETKQFIVTVAMLFIIVLGTFFYVYTRLDNDRSGPKKEYSAD
jgi:hypothetical protein